MSRYLLFAALLLISPLAHAEILVAAASDLSRLEAPLTEGFLKATGVRLRLSLGSSGMLARQIQNGAPFDVFLSANESYVQQLVETGHIREDSVRVYAVGRLALWSRSGSVKELGSLVDPGLRHLAIANPAHAPYGLAARQLLEHQGLWDRLAGKIVYGENVRQAMQFADIGNAEAAIIAWTLVFDRGGILLPERGHAPLVQAGGVVRSSAQPELAARFLAWLLSAEGQKLLTGYGLFPPPAKPRPRVAR